MRRMLCVPACVMLLGAAAFGQVVGWRMDGTSRYPDATPVMEWSATKNVVWKTEMPAWGNASPVIVADRILVCGEPTRLICVNKKDGSILWQKTNDQMDLLTPEEKVKAEAETKQAQEVQKKMRPLQAELGKAQRAARKEPGNAELKAKAADLAAQVADLQKQFEASGRYIAPPAEPSNGYSSATPVSDGKCVYMVFGTGVAVCHDLDGNRKWWRFIEKPKDAYGHSASPALAGDKVLVHIGQLVALNKDSGEEAWRADVPVRWGAPIVTRVGETEVAVTPSGCIVRTSDGKVLAKGLANLTYCAPVVTDGIAYFIESGGKAVELKPGPDETVETKTLWTTRPKKDRYYASPLVHDGLIYTITQAALFSVIDAKTGEVVYEKALSFGKDQAYSSVVLAKDVICLSRQSGTTLVMKPGRQPEQAAQNDLETFRSTPVFEGKRMYVRGLKNLYCIGE